MFLAVIILSAIKALQKCVQEYSQSTWKSEYEKGRFHEISIKKSSRTMAESTHALWSTEESFHQ